MDVKMGRIWSACGQIKQALKENTEISDVMHSCLDMALTNVKLVLALLEKTDLEKFKGTIEEEEIEGCLKTLEVTLGNMVEIDHWVKVSSTQLLNTFEENIPTLMKCGDNLFHILYH